MICCLKIVFVFLEHQDNDVHPRGTRLKKVKNLRFLWNYGSHRETIQFGFTKNTEHLIDTSNSRIMSVDREFLYREFDKNSLTSRVRLCQVRVLGDLGLSRAPASAAPVKLSFRVHATRLFEAKSHLA